MRNIFLYLFTFFLLLPFFFINYRLTAFHTFPFDNYYDYVLCLDGKKDMSVLGAPSGYRFIHYGTAFVFYKLLPLVPLSKLDVTGKVEEIRALQALAFTSFLFLHAFFFTVFLLLRNRLRRSMSESVGIAAVSLLFALHAYPHGVDPLYLFYTILCLYFVQNARVLYPLLLFSPVVNEKIALVFGVFFFGILWFESDRRRAAIPFLISVASFGLYLLIRKWINLPVGIYGYQTDITQFWVRVQLSWPILLSLKGFYTDWLPLLLILSVAAFAWKHGVFQKQQIYYHPAIIVIPLFLFILGVFACSDYGIGRLVMHALPFYVATLGLLLERMND